MGYDLTCVVTGHREGRVAVPTLRSFARAIKIAESRFTVQPLYFLDRPDDLTQQLFEKHAEGHGSVHVVDFGDQGKVRNAAVELAEGRYTAFLDGDDLWSSDWLVQALDFLADKPDTHIAHPAYNYFFEKQATIFCHVDQESDDFRPDLMRVGNYWDALCVCPTEIYREFPFYDRDLAGGWAYEDWYWNCQTVAGGKIHKVVPDSVLFKRRQKQSQTIRASVNKSLIKASPLSRYDCAFYQAQAEAAADGEGQGA